MNEKQNLLKKSCSPCEGGVPPLTGEPLKKLFSELKPGWLLFDERKLEKEYLFPDFATALAFTNKVGNLAEQEGHHPDIHLYWGRVKLVIWTHKVDGLTENDFILAAKCDNIG